MFCKNKNVLVSSFFKKKFIWFNICQTVGLLHTCQARIMREENRSMTVTHS